MTTHRHDITAPEQLDELMMGFTPEEIVNAEIRTSELSRWDRWRSRRALKTIASLQANMREFDRADFKRKIRRINRELADHQDLHLRIKEPQGWKLREIISTLDQMTEAQERVAEYELGVARSEAPALDPQAVLESNTNIHASSKADRRAAKLHRKPNGSDTEIPEVCAQDTTCLFTHRK